MSGITLPVERTALLVVELQNDIVHESLIGKRGIGGALAAQVQERGVLEKTRDVIAAGRTAGVPICYVNVEHKPEFPRPNAPIYRLGGKGMLIEGTWGAKNHDLVAPQAADHVFTRSVSIDGSYGSQLYPVLRMLRRDVLLVCGVSTNFAVEGIVRGSLNRGFEVLVIEDCCASHPDEWHEFSVRNILPLLGTVTSAEAVREGLASY